MPDELERCADVVVERVRKVADRAVGLALDGGAVEFPESRVFPGPVAFNVLPQTIQRAACARSASGPTITGDLPPSSSVTGTRFAAAFGSKVFARVRESLVHTRTFGVFNSFEMVRNWLKTNGLAPCAPPFAIETLHGLIETGEIMKRRSATGAGADVHVEAAPVPAQPVPVPQLPPGLTVRLTEAVEFPYLLLLVSGGHCQLLTVRGPGDFTRLGTTIDDAFLAEFTPGQWRRA